MLLAFFLLDIGVLAANGVLFKTSLLLFAAGVISAIVGRVRRARKPSTCVFCGAQLDRRGGHARWCASCGQRQPGAMRKGNMLSYGEAMVVGNGSATLTIYSVAANWRSSSGNPYDIPSAGQQWVCIDLGVRARSQSVTIGGDVAPGIVGSDGRIYDTMATTMDKRAFDCYAQIPRGQTSRGLYSVVVPAGVQAAAVSVGGARILPPRS